MSTAEPGVAEIVATTERLRQKELRDNIKNHNALLYYIDKEDGLTEESGGRTLLEEMFFQENGSFIRYEGAQVLNTSYNPTITAAEFNWKQFACAVVLSGLEKRMNEGEEGLIKLLKSRLKAADSTLENNLNADLFSDGTASGGLQVGGLKSMVSTTPTTGVVGGIDRSTTAGVFYRNYKYAAVATGGAAKSAANIKTYLNTCFTNTSRMTESVNLLVMGNTDWESLMGALQAIQRIADTKTADAGFRTIEYMGVPAVLGNGINFGGETLITATYTYGLNTKYLKLRVHKDCNMEPLPEVQSINQDAMVQLICWMGNLTLSGGAFQFVLFDS